MPPPPSDGNTGGIDGPARSFLAASHSAADAPARPYGYHITRVGFGAWAIGGPDWAVGWGHQDDRDSIAAIRHAVDLGINWIDTAAVYGLRPFRGGRSRGAERHPGRTAPTSSRSAASSGTTPIVPPLHAMSPSPSIRHELEASLRRLGVERIDLYQMHWPAKDGTPLEDYWQTLLDLKKEGQGPRGRDCPTTTRHSSRPPSASAMSIRCSRRSRPFAATSPAAELALVRRPQHRRHRPSPMQSGLLTGAFTLERSKALPADDWRSRNREFTGENLRRNLALAGAMKNVAN